MSVPRLGFVGLGWIGAMRLESVAASSRARIAAVCDAVPERVRAYADRFPEAIGFDAFDTMLERSEALGLDGVVIATPNALHVPQSLAALDRGLAVFCQKPLALDARGAREVVSAARGADRLLGVDFSYRYTEGAQALRRMVRSGELGRIFDVESVFHNAYGPDKAWCHDPALAGGGALIDLGVHQVDLPLWLLGYPAIRGVDGRVFRGGVPLDGIGIDDFATARIELDGGACIHMAVSWNAHAGCDCVIRTTVYGTRGGAEFRNVDGSFYDFELVRFDGRTRRALGHESRGWLGRGVMSWVERLATDRGYDPEIEGAVQVAEVVDAIYRRT